MTARRATRLIALYTILTIGGILALVPFWWLVRSALLDIKGIFEYPPILWPQQPRWGNFARAMVTAPFLLYFRNTLTILIPAVAGVLVTSSLSAYAFARLKFPLRNFWFSLLLSAIILPPAVTLIPQFLIWTRLRLVNTFYPLIVPMWFGGGAFNVFLLRQFFMTIPRELDDAAIIDGASHFRIYSQIILPLSKPALIAVGLFHFLFQWNDFFQPLIYLNDSSRYTLAIGLNQFRGSYATRWDMLMAASLIIVILPIIVFAIGQRYFIEGITLTGLRA